MRTLQANGGKDWSAKHASGYGAEDERGNPALAVAARAEREREAERERQRERQREREMDWGTNMEDVPPLTRKSSGDSIAALDVVVSGGHVSSWNENRSMSPALLRPRLARNSSGHQSFYGHERGGEEGWGGAATKGVGAVPSHLAQGKLMNVKLVNFNAVQVVPVLNQGAEWAAAATNARLLSEDAFSPHAGMAVSDLGVSAGKKRSLFPGNGAVLLLRESKRKKRGPRMLVAALFALCFFSCLFFAASHLASPLGRVGSRKSFASGQLEMSMASRLFGMSAPRRAALEERGGEGLVRELFSA